MSRLGRRRGQVDVWSRRHGRSALFHSKNRPEDRPTILRADRSGMFVEAATMARTMAALSPSSSIRIRLSRSPFVLMRARSSLMTARSTASWRSSCMSFARSSSVEASSVSRLMTGAVSDFIQLSTVDLGTPTRDAISRSPVFRTKSFSRWSYRRWRRRAVRTYEEIARVG